MDLIDRQAAMIAVTAGSISAATVFGRTEHGMTALKETIRAIKELPSVQQELIRCKDCKHWKIGTENLSCPNPAVCGLHSFMHGFERASLPEDYCSWAERRTDEQTKD